jgi:hypothetical protein
MLTSIPAAAYMPAPQSWSENSARLKPIDRKSFVIGERSKTRLEVNPLMKTASMAGKAPIPTSVFGPPAVPPCGAAPSIILVEEHRLSRSAHSFFRALRVSLSGSIDSSAFQNVSSGREVSIIFTPNGPLIYRWESNNTNSPARS